MNPWNHDLSDDGNRVQPNHDQPLQNVQVITSQDQQAPQRVAPLPAQEFLVRHYNMIFTLQRLNQRWNLITTDELNTLVSYRQRLPEHMQVLQHHARQLPQEQQIPFLQANGFPLCQMEMTLLREILGKVEAGLTFQQRQRQEAAAASTRRRQQEANSQARSRQRQRQRESQGGVAPGTVPPPASPTTGPPNGEPDPSVTGGPQRSEATAPVLEELSLPEDKRKRKRQPDTEEKQAEDPAEANTDGYPPPKPDFARRTEQNKAVVSHLQTALQAPPLDDPQRTYRKSLQALVDEIDPSQELTDQVAQMLSEVADEFVDSVIGMSCRIAVNRYKAAQHANGGEQQMETEDQKWSDHGKVGMWDVQLALEKNWDIKLPQLPRRRDRDGEISYMPAMQREPTQGYLDKLAAVKKANESGKERYTDEPAVVKRQKSRKEGDTEQNSK